MRTLLVTLVITLGGCVAQAQDDAMQAAQLAVQQSFQASQLATQQAIQAMQASQQAAQSSQIAMQDTTPPPVGLSLTATPKFSVKQGAFSAPVTVKIQDASRGAIIYYTTDGWTPTINSTRYKGPITIDSNTTFKPLLLHLILYEVGWPPPNTQSKLPTRLCPQRPRHPFCPPRQSLPPSLLMANSCSPRALRCDLSLPRP
jgi:hypothetical protein